MGASDFHDLDSEIPPAERSYKNSAELSHARMLPDDDPVKNEEKLLEAIDSFVLSGAVKLYRESQRPVRFRHHTMLVHQAMKRAYHREQAEQIRGLWSSAGYHSATCLGRLRTLYETDILPVSQAIGELPTPEFAELPPFVSGAVERIGRSGNPVLIVNSDRIEGEELDFDRNDRLANPCWRQQVRPWLYHRGLDHVSTTAALRNTPTLLCRWAAGSASVTATKTS